MQARIVGWAAGLVVGVAVVAGVLIGTHRAPSNSGPRSTPTPLRTPSVLARPAVSPSPTPKPRPTPSPTPASSLVAGHVNRTSLALVARYDVTARLSFDRGTLAADEAITLRNVSGRRIDGVELNTVTARLGALDLRRLTVDGKAVKASIDDQTVVVPLGGVLPDGASVRIGLSFAATLRSDVSGSDWLFTRANGIVDANRWLPWVSLRRPFDRPNYGDPFITTSSPLVRVRLTTDRPLVIAATGQRTAVNDLTQTFEARNVRDFNFTASPSYRVTEARVGRTTVLLFSLAGYPASTVMSYATDALVRMQPLAGAYPYPTFTIAQHAGGDGMESPQLIWIQGGIGGRQLHWLVYHETAHQWFYGIVGSDQAYQPFADEAAADHLARTVSGVWRDSYCGIGRLDLSIYRYSPDCYFETIYIQGSL